MVKKQASALAPFNKRIRKYWPLLLMMLPAIVLLIIFCYIPMSGILMAFEDYKIKFGLFGSEFVGLKHFRELFASKQFWQVISNTLYISVLKLVLGFFPPILFALLLKEIRIPWFRKLTQTFSYLPYFISWIIMAGIIREMFSTNGAFNQIIGLFGVQPQVWLSIKETFVPILVGTDIWKNFGWNSIIYFSALSAIDPVLYEAASLDGASRLKMATRITLPCLIPTITIQLILSMSGVMNAGFDQVFNLSNSAVTSVANIIDTYVYTLGIQQLNYSVSTAVGLFKSVIALLLMISTNWIAKKINGEEFTLW